MGTTDAHADFARAFGTQARTNRRANAFLWRASAVGLLGFSLLAVRGVHAQSTAEATQPAVEATSAPVKSELPATVLAALAGARDFTLNFWDQPGFLAVVEFVERSPRSPGFAQAPVTIDDWRVLLERPGDFRGRPVTVSGIVERNKDPFRFESRQDLGYLGQLELRREDQPLRITGVLTQSARDIPLDSKVTLTGYFVLVRDYQDAASRLQHAAVLVTPGPTRIERITAVALPAPPVNWRWLLIASIAGLAIAWLILRRATGRGRTDLRTLESQRAAPQSLADDLATWAEGEERSGAGGPDDGGPKGAGM